MFFARLSCLGLAIMAVCCGPRKNLILLKCMKSSCCLLAATSQMAVPTIQSLEDDAKAPLRDRAAHTGRSREGKVRLILHARVGGSSGAILVAQSKALRVGVDGAS